MVPPLPNYTIAVYHDLVEDLVIALCSLTALEAFLVLHTSLAPGSGVEHVDLDELLGQVGIVGADIVIVPVVVAAEESSIIGMT